MQTRAPLFGHDLGIGAADAAGAAGDDDRLAAHVEHLLQCRHSSSRVASSADRANRAAANSRRTQPMSTERSPRPPGRGVASCD